ncbi:sulfatase-like hydrolase/transferase [Microbulbifer halophilus]|uniref:Sulfatase-like hydrolase/transferase n=1 Tax=Microbulbifer halophilus TaxID=453963 RepID=A0ABW5EGZ6_9GAMM|nr:sulfatase-like hydrolase/transferase [Microbulbifer halophilus]MCW8128243.1 sulfatase-like hydrolase/transferase [Microbulbifer halophilus]
MTTNNRRWNFLIITTDEERYPPVYEEEELRKLRRDHLHGVSALRENSLEMHRHYAASTACSPSRACIYTGQYPSLHGVSQTSGMAKQWYDPDMFYLDPNTVPTMGDYFRAGGYRTFYRGKWHLSHPDIILPGSVNIMMSTESDGTPIPRATELYKAANKLQDFGFDGWIGPDPHGAAQANMGINRDPGFANQIIRLLDDLEKDDSDQPWLTVASFTNPHDIVFFGTPWLSFGYDYQFPDFIRNLKLPMPPTRCEDLSSKPRAQKDYVEKYGEMFFRNPTIPQYFQLYYHLQCVVDREIHKVYQRLRNSRFFENTIVVYTSDHGDMLGAHGGMHQKWYNAYEETVHVPFIISNPELFSGQQHSQALSSHVDIVPTLMGLAGIDRDEAADQLKPSHSEVHPLVGADLSELVSSGGESGGGSEALYFMTDDEVSDGLTDVNPRGNPYTPVSEPCHVETVITDLPDEHGNPQHWKYSRYYSNPKFWGGASNPDQSTLLQPEGGPAEFELYNLSEDPLESINLAGTCGQKRAHETVIRELETLLLQQRGKKRLQPNGQLGN